MPRPPHRLFRALAAVAATVAVIPAASARAGDVTAFVALPAPAENWSRGYGAALTSTWFNVLTFEGEAARVAGETPEAGMTSFTARDLLSPALGSIGRMAGRGVGSSARRWMASDLRTAARAGARREARLKT